MKQILQSHLLHNVCAIVALTIVVAARTCLAFDPNEWRNTQALEVPTKGLVRVIVPAATLDAAQPSLEDLRIIDPTGNQVPYLIERLLPGPESTITPAEFRSTIENGATRLILKTGTSAPIIGVSLETPATRFMKAADVEGSNDGTTWTKLAGGDSLFQLPNGATKLRVSFPDGAWQFLRVTIDDLGSPPMPFTGAHLNRARTTAPAEAVAVAIKSRDESPGTTRLALDLGAANLTLGSLRIESNEPLFTRAVTLAVPEVGDDGIRERNIADAVIYRVNVNGKNEARLEIPLESKIHTRELVVLIRNEDSPPISIDTVRADRRLVRLTFFANQPGQYLLLSGNTQCAAPRYDLSALSGKLRNATATDVVPSALVPNPNYKPPEALAALTLTGAQIDVTKWKFRKPLPLTQNSVQQVELDPELLARSKPDQRDIRIVRGAYQLPFLFERTSLSRPISLSAAAANDPKRPALSRWSLKLSQPGVPVTRLVCRSSSPLFHRQMRLWEEVTDERGDKFASELGRATWDQTPDAPKRELVIDLNGRPQSDTLFLETDDGDNPAIELRDFRSYYPVTRVIFKATPDPAQPVWLYYGNLDATAPRYDLTLVAGELLKAERSTVTAGPEENLSPKPSLVDQTLTGSTRYVFWGALALVVIVLLAIMSRFLPENAATMKFGIRTSIWRLIVLCIVYLLLMIFGHLPDHLILFPTRAPIEAGGAVRKAVPFERGELEIWVARSRRAQQQSRADIFILRFYGNADRADRWAAMEAEMWNDRAVEIWGMNYPGFGGSTGPARLARIGPAAVEAFDVLRREAADAPILAYGVSIGVTAALHVAASRPAEIAGLILHNPPPLREMILRQFGWWNLWLLAGPVALQIPRDLDCIANARATRAPAIFLLAERDEIVAPRFHRLVVQAYAGEKRIIELRGAYHNDPIEGTALANLNDALGWVLTKASSPRTP